jgi:hypothetical protein
MAAAQASTPRVSWGKLLNYKQTWALAIGKFFNRRCLVVLSFLVTGLPP